MKITGKDLIGDIKGFPIEVVEKMIERQVEQGDKADVDVFQYTATGGFFWDETTEGCGFWSEVIINKNFDLFFEKYPKKEEDYWIDPKGRRMLVWDGDGDECCAEERIVIAKLPSNSGQRFVAVNALCVECFENGDVYDTMLWHNAKPIPETIELTLDQIAEKFNTTSDKIKIKK